MAAANTESPTRPLPPNQVSTMSAYPNPSYPMPPGAVAIRRSMMGGAGPAGAAIGAGAGSGVPGTAAGLGVNFGAPAPGGDVQTMIANQQASQNDTGAPPAASGPYGAIGGLGGSATPTDAWQAAHDYWTAQAAGPTTQTAAGGVIGAPDLSTPNAWRDFMNSRLGRPPTGAGRVQPPVVMQSSRVQNPAPTRYGRSTTSYVG